MIARQENRTIDSTHTHTRPRGGASSTHNRTMTPQACCGDSSMTFQCMLALCGNFIPYYKARRLRSALLRGYEENRSPTISNAHCFHSVYVHT